MVMSRGSMSKQIAKSVSSGNKKTTKKENEKQKIFRGSPVKYCLKCGKEKMDLYLL